MTETGNNNPRHTSPVSFYSRYARTTALNFLKASAARKLSYFFAGSLALCSMPAALALRSQNNSSPPMNANSSLLRSSDGKSAGRHASQEGNRDNNRIQSSTRVTVNGQNMPVPSNGSTRQTLPSTNTQSSVDVTIENHSSGTVSPRTRSSTSVDIRSHSSSSSTSVNNESRRDSTTRGR